jgi:serine/threonine-protein kinase RsbW
VEIAFTVRLPVDSTSVPFIRGLCRQALEHLRVEPVVVDEIALALTEACANVVQHAGDHGDYEVQVAIDDALCRISVFDDGDGFDPDALPEDLGDSPMDGGRGLLLMQALVDRLDFRHDPDGRHRVTLEKRLTAPPPLRLVDPV